MLMHGKCSQICSSCMWFKFIIVTRKIFHYHFIRVIKVKYEWQDLRSKRIKALILPLFVSTEVRKHIISENIFLTFDFASFTIFFKNASCHRAMTHKANDLWNSFHTLTRTQMLNKEVNFVRDTMKNHLDG